MAELRKKNREVRQLAALMWRWCGGRAVPLYRLLSYGLSANLGPSLIQQPAPNTPPPSLQAFKMFLGSAGADGAVPELTAQEQEVVAAAQEAARATAAAHRGRGAPGASGSGGKGKAAKGKGKAAAEEEPSGEEAAAASAFQFFAEAR